MGVRHVCIMCVILWTALSQIYSAPMPRTTDLSLAGITRPGTGDITGERNSAIAFPTEQARTSTTAMGSVGHRNIFLGLCAKGRAAVRGGGCARVASPRKRSRIAFNPIFFDF